MVENVKGKKLFTSKKIKNNKKTHFKKIQPILKPAF